MKFDKSTYEEVVLFQCREILKLQLFSVTSVPGAVNTAIITPVAIRYEISG